MKEIVLGIDIGGTNVCYGIIKKDGTPIYISTTKTTSWDKISDLLRHIKEDITTEFSAKIKGIGIGIPNGNYFSGTIENSPNLPWKGLVNVKKISEDIFGVKTFVDNDANLAAIGEKTFGEAKDIKDFAVITLGTGLGSGLFLENKLIRGHWGLAGELGHINVGIIEDENFIAEGRTCGCGKLNCLETYVSATGLKRTFITLMAKRNIPTLLSKHTYEELNSKLIYQAALKGDSIALEAFRLTGKILGTKLADLVLITSISTVFLSGGLAKALNLFSTETELALNKHLIPPYEGKEILIKKSKIDLNWDKCPECSGEAGVGVLGAAGLVYLETK